MNMLRFFWRKLRWFSIVGIALLVAGFAMFLAAHRAVPARIPGHTAAASQTGAFVTTCGKLLPNEPPPEGATDEFMTDFSKHCVPYNQVFSGGPPKDAIPALSHPKFVPISQADSWLKSTEPVIFFQVGNDARAYPIQILIWHEIVNDTVGGVPVAVTFCPLCNTAIAFERTVKGRVLDFGTTGRLRFSNLLMYDRQTESWWQQITGQAIIGALTFTTLVPRPASIIAWATFKAAYPSGHVLSRDTGYGRPYGQNPYTGYDNVNQSPFLYSGPPIPGKLRPMVRILIVVLNGDAVVYPFDVLKQVQVVNDTVGNTTSWSCGRPVRHRRWIPILSRAGEISVPQRSIYADWVDNT